MSRSRLRTFILGNAASAAIGLALGLLASTLYTWRQHPEDPDPVDFRIGGIVVVTTLAAWVLGSGITWWTIRRRARRER